MVRLIMRRTVRVETSVVTRTVIKIKQKVKQIRVENKESLIGQIEEENVEGEKGKKNFKLKVLYRTVT